MVDIAVDRVMAEVEVELFRLGAIAVLSISVAPPSILRQSVQEGVWPSHHGR